MSLIEFDRAAKVYGGDWEHALALSRDSVSAADIRARTDATVALAETSLSIEPGEVFMVMGLSGSGKSTLLRLINGLISPSAGHVRVDGADIGSLSEAGLRALRRERMSMVFQGFALLPHRTVTDNVAFGLELQDMSAPARDAVTQAWIEKVGLDGFEQAFPRELSGGMRQRVGLARALATGADILLMDEPFSALDPLIRREMQDLLADLEKDLKKTIVFVTHDLAEAVKLGGRIAILREGRLVQVGTRQEILDTPANDYVRAFTEDLRTSRQD